MMNKKDKAIIETKSEIMEEKKTELQAFLGMGIWAYFSFDGYRLSRWFNYFRNNQKSFRCYKKSLFR
jgi:hypothetical protein